MENTVEKWGCFEVSLEGPRDGNPFTDVRLKADFANGGRKVSVNGFYDGEGVYRIRFMPDEPGEWSYVTGSNSPALDGKTGILTCRSSEKEHGPVRVKNHFHFAYADGKPYFPFGTTCYAWIHQSEELQRQTLKTLAAAPFNKIRMCVFPKHYDYNHNEPALYPYEGSIASGFDFKRPNPAFYRHLEKRILDLKKLGIECDLILFHPYDRWGFSAMGEENDDFYLGYVVSRLSAFSNVWWSLANEYDLMELAVPATGKTAAKKPADWDRFAGLVARNDPYRHLLSVHNCMKMFDHTKPWVTHCSIQRVDVYRTAENTDEWRKQYGKPVVIDECAYEGNINHGWGNITGEEMTRRFWEGVLRGGYVGHGETYVHPKDILWWSHGGELHGSSPARIAFLRRIVEEAPTAISPDERCVLPGQKVNWDVTVGTAGDGYFLYYFGFNQPSFRTFEMPAGKKYHVDVIDTWNMAVTPLPETFEAKFRIELPGRQYMAARITAIKE